MIRSQTASIRPSWKSLGFRTLLIACGLLLGVGCEDPKKAKEAAQAKAALEAREHDVTSREAETKASAAKLIEREKAIEKAQAEIETQRAELKKLKTEAEAELLKARQLRASIEEQERRGPVPRISADRVIVIDPLTDIVLFEKNADKRGPVASTQKLLTSLIVIEAGNLDGNLIVQESDTKCAPVRIGLKTGDAYPRRQLLTALLVKSANDIAQALARDNAGSLEAFADKMNARAEKLGMKNSHFANPNGLPIENQYSTARDMSLVAKADDVLPEIREIVTLKTYVFQKPNGQTETLTNTNHVLHNYPLCDGMKTGYTDEAGHCLICSGQKDGKRRIVVVLNDSREGIWRDAQALLEWALKG